MRDDDSAGRSDVRRGRLLVICGLALAVLGVALFSSALVVLAPLPATVGEFAVRWGVRGLAALLVSGGMWCAWTGWKRLHG